MDTALQIHWPEIMGHFEQSIRSSRFYTFATTTPEGEPHMAPYASLILNDDCTGYYSDAFPDKTSRNLRANPNVCISAVRMGFGFWFKALLSGGFPCWPCIRLYGTVGPSRKAEPGEIDRWRRHMKPYRWMKGYKLLWADIRTVRDIRFQRFEPIQLGRMPIASNNRL
nr:pyridoxamine 5'-phosphate oxidase family protein [uncultured Desulfobacter sp.]